MAKDCCKNCKFNNGSNCCVRFPPTPVVYTDRPDENPYVHIEYTFIYEDGWCGEYKSNGHESWGNQG